MKTQKLVISKVLFLIFGLIIVLGCDREETLQPMPIFETEEESSLELDQYLKKEFRDPYGSNIIYKFVDRFIDPTKKAIPPRQEVVKPVAEMIKSAWVAPYNTASDQGEEFLKRYFPGEIVILGSALLNGDGTATLGLADSGVRITITEANKYDANDQEWQLKTFRTLQHEFAHVIDQTFNFDVEPYFNISKGDYTTSGTWTTLIEDGEFSEKTINNAITRGMVTAYATSSPGEDFAELIAYIITTDPAEFEATYLTLETCVDPNDVDTEEEILACIARNEGRKRIQEKYDFIIKYMQEDVGVDLLKVRDEFLKVINQ